MNVEELAQNAETLCPQRPPCGDCTQCDTAALLRSQAEGYERLKDALETYGQHHRDCDKWFADPYIDERVRKFCDDRPCTCGFSKALKDERDTAFRHANRGAAEQTQTLQACC